MDGSMKTESQSGFKEVTIKLMGQVITAVVENQAENPQPAFVASRTAPLPGGVAPFPLVVAGAPAPPPPPPAGVAPLPPTIANEIRARGGTRLTRVCTKDLTPSDVNLHLGRLLVPMTRSFLDYLNEDERRTIEECGNNRSRSQKIEVDVVGSGGVWYRMVLKKWQKMSSLVFNEGWNNVVAGMKFQAGDKVELWFFRANDRLGVAIALNNVYKKA